MLSTYHTFTKTVFVLLIVAATCQLAINAPIVRRCTLSPAEANFRDGLLVHTGTINETDPANATELAIGKACNLLGYYNLLKEGGNFNNSTILHFLLEQNVLDACTAWVKSGNSSCAVNNLPDLKHKCVNLRWHVPTMLAEAFNKTQALLGGCPGQPFDHCSWLNQTLTPQQCSRSGLDAQLNCSCS